MKKILYVSILSLCVFTSCHKNCSCTYPEPLQLSISGKIDCPNRSLTALNPNDYTIKLMDSSGLVVVQTIQPNANGTYTFMNLEQDETYNIVVTRTTLAHTVPLASNQVETYLSQTPRPVLSELALLAGDVNKDGNVDGTDALHINRFINGQTPTIAGGRWRFLNKYIIDSRNNFDFNVAYPLKNMRASVTNFDFIMVELGDLSLNGCR